jgi:cobalt-zinc-cadmium efflux system outer membrane protein
MIARLSFAPLVALAVTVAGCASASPPGDGFSNVRQSVSDRSGHRVHWNRDSAEDAQAVASVRRLLAEPLSSEAAVQVALLNNPSLQATYEDVGVAQAELVGAGLLRNPVFDAELRFPEGGGSTKVVLTVVADFLDVFQIPLRKRLAKTALQTAELRTADAVLSLAAEVREAYADAVAAQQLLELRRTVNEAAAAAADVAKRLHDAGNLTDLALVSEQALAESAQLELTSAEAEAQAARQRLGQLIGSVDDAWQLPLGLPDAPRESFAVDELEATALKQRLDLRAAERRIRNAQHALGGAQRFGGVDELELGGGAEREEGDWSFGPNLAIPLPFFNQGQPRIAAARAELRRSRAQRDALILQTRAEVRTAAAQLTAALSRVARLRDVVLPLRRRIVDETQLQYNAMDVGIFDLLRAKQDEVTAQAQHVAALRDYWTARAKLERAAGGRFPGGVPSTQPATAPAAPASAPTDAQQHHHHNH